MNNLHFPPRAKPTGDIEKSGAAVTLPTTAELTDVDVADGRNVALQVLQNSRAT